MNTKPLANIAYLTNNPNLGSTARVFLDWFQLGKEYGFNPIVLLPKNGPLKQWLISQGIAHRLTDASPISKNKLLHGVRELSLAAWFLRKSGASVIHCMEHNCYPFAWRLGRLLSIPVICHIQYKLERDYCTWAFGKGHPPFRLIWTARSQMRDSLEAVNGIVPNETQIVLPMGVDPVHFGVRVDSRIEMRAKFGFSDDHCVFGIACAFRRRKRIHDFIEMIKHLITHYPHIRGMIAGGPVHDELDYDEQLRRSIVESGLSDFVKMVGDIVDVEPFHQATDISVSTSEYETFGMSVCEAMACAKPVIGYEGGSIREVIGNSACIAPTGDVNSLTKIAEKLVIDAEMRSTFGSLARTRVIEDFSPRKTFRVLSEIYRSAIDC